MPPFGWLAGGLAKRALSTPVPDMSGGAGLPGGQARPGLARGAASYFMGRDESDKGVEPGQFDMTAGGGVTGAGVPEGALSRMGGDDPYVGGAHNRVDPELAGQLAQGPDPNYLRQGLSALGGHHEGGLPGAMEGWTGSVDQQQKEYDRKVKRRFWGNRAQGARARSGGL